MLDLALTTSASEDWQTPQHVFDQLDRAFAFRLDACASPENAKCERFFTKDDDALVRDWACFDRVWCNPPYGRPIARFVEKAWRTSQDGALVVCLVPSRTDTRWWHDWVQGRALVQFFKGRVSFDRHVSVGSASAQPSAAPFASALLIYLPQFDVRSGSDQSRPRMRPAGSRSVAFECADGRDTDAQASDSSTLHAEYIRQAT